MRRTIGATLVAGVLVLAGCSSDGNGSSTTTTSAARGQATESACRTEARTVRIAAEAYRAQMDTYPASAADLVGDYLKAAPKLHSWDGNKVVLSQAGIDAGCPEPASP